MINAAKVHRQRGPEAAAHALKVNGPFAERNAARRAAFTGDYSGTADLSIYPDSPTSATRYGSIPQGGGHAFFDFPSTMSSVSMQDHAAQQPEMPWYARYLSTPEGGINRDRFPVMSDFSFLDLAWNPLTGSNEPITSSALSFPKLFAPGGYLTEDDMSRNNWRWASIDELNDTDPLYKTINDVEDKYVVDASGALVPKSTVNNWLNSYERQTPYQQQNDIAATGEVNRAVQHRLNQEFNRQVDNFFMGNWARPSQLVGAFNPHGDNLGIPFSQRLFLGTGNTGIVSPEFMQEHPYIGEGLNMVFDAVMPGAIGEIPNMGKSAYRLMERYTPQSAYNYGIFPDGFNFDIGHSLSTGPSENEIIQYMVETGQSRDAAIRALGGVPKTTKGTAPTMDIRGWTYEQVVNDPNTRQIIRDLRDAELLTEVHPDLPAGTTKREMVDLVNKAREEFNSRDKFRTLEILGHDLSSDSAPMLLRNIERIQKEMIGRGEFPGIVDYNPNPIYPKTLNDYGKINWGTKEAPHNPWLKMDDVGSYMPFGKETNRQYVTPEDIASWPTPEESVDLINSRLSSLHKQYAPYSKKLQEAGEDAFKAKVNYKRKKIEVPDLMFVFKNGGLLNV